MDNEQGETGLPWTRAEVEATVATYFQMLRMQELGQKANKAEHNRRLLAALPARSIQAVEYKHRNISAVMSLYGAQALSGYKPAANFQQLLVEVVGNTLAQDRAFDEAALRSVERPAETPVVDNFEDFVVEAPKAKERVQEQRAEWIRRSPIKRDYLEREARNRSLGLAGELLVMEFEARRLHEQGAKRYVDRIEHVSQVRGDGTGYDILSFDTDGRERFIEVKTTAYMAETPFFVTPNELDFSSEQSRQFHLYRLFAFRRKPQMFVLTGPVAANCLLEPHSYRATVIGT
ncbi:DUF3883 domain-containing protein [Lysobacter soli]|uniref:DUF3883 domain-containing protein n=1 Tax=Lysobacter soli TaxID=453783 RepID=UPI0012EDF5A3|nr:DUF3883 domain-containing protein [Lysobacter soli]QGW66499.1 DUF3883 domain-containing protein [Lysobacter soli]